MAKNKGLFARMKSGMMSGATEYALDTRVVKTLMGIAQKASLTADSINRYVPKMEIMGNSVCDNIVFATKFSMIASTAGIGIAIVAVYQGIEAMNLIGDRIKGISEELRVLTTLNAMEVVPKYIYDFIREGLDKQFDDGKSHWFFVYHPDTFWTPRFCKSIRERPLDPRFVGYTNQLDALFIFLLATRAELTREEREARRNGEKLRSVKFHVIIPVHQPTVLPEFLKFPEKVGDFIVEGKTYGNKELVWLNLPPEQERFLDGIGNWEPPTPSSIDIFMSWAGLREMPRQEEPRVLGCLPQHISESDESSDSELDSPVSEHKPDVGDNLSLPGSRRRVRRRRRKNSKRNDVKLD
ncbi:hypothetical protein N7509_001145 [Penicillium cosmopolitanum]|uniref:Uncharacterized protein n=1 Tax=Penicillium cosmopolitanum TaxID=1131564 RepID=A0A9W9WBW6_9EURO|nr:uncharacterized protein N7509_001145 [Penicillium cosmopolitanum]KAJ5414518.1 hypothetical protein N7509_001145 [Penicillium cosmopolitanum]